SIAQRPPSPLKRDAADESTPELQDGCDAETGSSDSEDLEYAYLPLQAGEIRLLKILNTPQVHGSCAIEITLLRHNLEHCADYIAVSYAWGASKPNKMLETDDGTLILITSNLWDFLIAQSKELAGKLLWIDQIS